MCTDVTTKHLKPHTHGQGTRRIRTIVVFHRMSPIPVYMCVNVCILHIDTRIDIDIHIKLDTGEFVNDAHCNAFNMLCLCVCEVCVRK